MNHRPMTPSHHRRDHVGTALTIILLIALFLLASML